MSLFVAEINKLKNVQNYLEKNANLHIAKFDPECEDLCGYLTALEKNRKNDEEQVIREIKDIWSLLNEKKKSLQNDNIHTVDLKNFKKHMIDLQAKIHALKIKLKCNLESLRDEENGLSQITETYNQKQSDWEKRVEKLPNSDTINKKILSRKILNKEVQEFMDFVGESNGHENGWTNEDHRLFQKLRRKHKNTETLAFNLNKMLPDISIDEIKEHQRWYTKYLALKKRKDAALQQWRSTKSENIQENNTKLAPNCADSNNKSKHKVVVSSNETTREKIAQWKNEKEEKRRQEKMTEELRREQIRQRKEQEKELHVHVKKEVEKWREAKMSKVQSEQVQKQIMEYEEKKLRASEANEMIKKFQSQDDMFIAKIRRSKMKKKSETKRSQSSYLVPRDPERVLKPTKQWLLRTSKDNYVTENTSTFIPNIKEVPKLGIPQWRKSAASSI